MRIVVLALFFIAFSVGSTTSRAIAQSSACLPLQMELAELNRSGSGSSRNERAIRQELSRLKAQERRSGCRSFFRSRGSRSTCRSIRSRISSLERRLPSSRGYSRFGRSSVDRRRDRVRQALVRNGCALYARAYRTICVRVCDGYYFPLSNTSSRQRFSQDAQKCMGQYGPGQAELFYHPFPHGDASQAVSLNGQRYFDQPYAFAYRSNYIPQCATQLQAGLSALHERVYAAIPSLPESPQPTLPLGQQFEAAVEKRMQTLSVTIPIARPVWSSDPETLANRAGGLAPKLNAAPQTEIALVGNASRGVGDPYYYVESPLGPPPTVPGYQRPEIEDFRRPQRASLLQITR